MPSKPEIWDAIQEAIQDDLSNVSTILSATVDQLYRMAGQAEHFFEDKKAAKAVEKVAGEISKIIEKHLI